MISNYLFTQKRLDKDGVSMDCEIYTWYVIHTLNILLKDRTTNNNNILLHFHLQIDMYRFDQLHLNYFQYNSGLDS